jgi:hypothetical protein
VTAPQELGLRGRRRFVDGSLGAVLLIGGLGTAGWVTGVEWMAAVLPGVPVSSPNGITALLLLALSAVLVDRQGSSAARAFCLLVATAAAGLAVASISASLGGPGAALDGVLVRGRGLALEDLEMSFATAVGLLAVALSHAAWMLAAQAWRIRFVLACVAAAAAVLPLLGHLYAVEQLVRPLGYRVVGPASSLALLAFAIAIGANALPPDWVGLLASRRAAGVILSRLLPLSFVSLVAIGYPRLMGERRGLYGVGLGTALMVIASGFVIGWLLIRTATALDREQRRADEEAQAALAYQELLGRQALELNDDVIQGLSAAWLALQLGRADTAAEEIRRATHQAQRIASEQLQASGRVGTDLASLLTRAAPSSDGALPR